MIPTQCSSTFAFFVPQKPKELSRQRQQTEMNEKSQRTTLCISNSGFSANLKHKNINQRSVLSDSLVG